MSNCYEVLIWGETFYDTDALFSFLIRADDPDQAREKAESILASVFFSSCTVGEVSEL